MTIKKLLDGNVDDEKRRAIASARHSKPVDIDHYSFSLGFDKGVEAILERLQKWLFSDDVTARNALQQSGLVHPYTCGDDRCRADLRAVPGGWVCDRCGYEQDFSMKMEDGE